MAWVAVAECPSPVAIAFDAGAFCPSHPSGAGHWLEASATWILPLPFDPVHRAQGYVMPFNDHEIARRIDAVCREFEEAWQNRRPVAIETLLPKVDDSHRETLLVELIALERELLAKQGVAVRRDDYLARFTLYAEAVDRAFDESIAVRPLSHLDPYEAPTLPPAAPWNSEITEFDAREHKTQITTDETILKTSDAFSQDTIAGKETTDSDETMDFKGKPKTTGEPLGKIRYFGDYVLERELARGGMGVVYLARQVNLNRVVALKMILAGQLASEEDVKRFYLEAEAAANLDHPGIVPIYEVGQHDGQHYFSMGYVDGRSLAQEIAENPLQPRDAAELLVQLTEAVQYAHDKGVIHRDLKPGNVLIDAKGRARVTDFGLAKKLKSDSNLTHTGQVMGTPSYMPPEQAEGAEVGPPADVYALGAILYCLLTGRPPFQAATPLDTLIQVVGQDPVPMRQLNPSVPRDLETIGLKCLEKEPRKRYESAKALGDDLRRYLNGEPIVARPVTPVERVVKWARRRPLIAGLAAALAVALVGGFSGMAFLWARAENNATKAEESAKTETKAKTEAQRQATIATEKAEALRRKDYNSRIYLAYRECLDNNVNYALELLNGCPTDLRGWEWNYVYRQCRLDLQSFDDKGASVNAVAFSPDGKFVASGSGAFLGSSYGDLIIREVATGKEVHRAGFPDGIQTLAFSPDGKRLALGHGPNITLFDTSSFHEIFNKSSGPNTIDSVAFTPDSARVITGSGGEPGYVKFWDAATGEQLGDSLSAFEGSEANIAVSPDGRELAVTASGRVEVWELPSRKPLRTLKGHYSFVYAVAYSPDGRYLASGSFDTTIRLWDRATGNLIRVLPGHEGFVRGLAFSPDSRWIVSGAEDKSVKLWSVDSDRELTTFHGHQQYVISVAFSPDGHRIASGSSDRTMKLWYASPSPQLTFQGHTGWVNSVAFNPDGKQVASAGGLNSTINTLQSWDPLTGERIRVFSSESIHNASVVFSGDGQKLAISNGGYVAIRNAMDGKPLFFVRGNAGGNYEPANIVFSPDGKRLVLGDDSGVVRVWDMSNGQEVQTLKGHTKAVDGVAFSGDGTKLATGSDDTTIKIWDTVTWREIQTLKGHKLDISSVAFSPDGRSLASVGGISMKGGEAFSPDGRRLATASDDRTIKLWDTATGEDVFTLRGHAGGVLCVAFSRDGKRIASGSIDQTAKVWDTEPLTFDQNLQRTAVPLVAKLSRELTLKDDVIDRLRNDPKLDEPLRAAALKVAERLHEDANFLNNTAWPIVANPDRKPEEYQRALRFAETACKLAPQMPVFLNTLGVARYRAGLYKEALADLNRSLVLNTPQYNGPNPADMAFIAMAHQKLGETDDAKKTLERLRGVMSLDRWAFDSESADFLGEAGHLIDPENTSWPPMEEVADFKNTIEGPVENARFSPDGKLLLTAHDDQIMALWDVESRKLIRVFHDETAKPRTFSVAFSPDGRRALSGGADMLIRLWDIDTGALIRVFKGHTEWIFNVGFSNDGKLAFSTAGGVDNVTDGVDSAVRVWEVETGKEIRKLEGHKGRVLGMAVLPDGKSVLTAGDTSLILWDTTTGKETRRFKGHTAVLENVAVFDGGRRAVSGGYDRTLRFWDLASGQETDRFFGHSYEVTGLAVSPDGKRLLSSDYNGRDLALWDIENRRLIRKISWGLLNPVRGSFSPDGKLAVWCGTGGVIRLYKFPTP